jgi:hypothetical protein
MCVKFAPGLGLTDSRVNSRSNVVHPADNNCTTHMHTHELAASKLAASKRGKKTCVLHCSATVPLSEEHLKPRWHQQTVH